MPTEERRICALKILAEQFPDESHKAFLKIAVQSKHIDVKVRAILLTSLYRNETDVKQLWPLIEDESSPVRSAAIDAIGIIYSPAYQIPVGDEFLARHDQIQVLLIGNPPINLAGIRGDKKSDTNRPGPRFDKALTYPVPKIRREKLLNLMATASHSRVREAAARAMIRQPEEGYRLRLAEWGVWINDKEDLILTQSILDEIPPFVHRTGNSMSDISKDRQEFVPVTKPIIHFEVDRPMAIDLSVRINAGRPWFTYPLPDDFSLDTTANMFSPIGGSPVDVPKPLGLTSLKELREGYPWVDPPHRINYFNDITEVGFRWQSLILLPEQANWMKLEPVIGENFQWWNRLRNVPCSWVSSRGESERFVYYDGPTEDDSPISASIKDQRLVCQVPKQYVFVHPNIPNKTSRAPQGHYERELIFISVTPEAISGTHDSVTFKSSQEHSFSILEPKLKGDQVIEKLMEVLMEQGLTKGESEGLIDCWRPQFFETKGQRLLTVFGKDEYDRVCPMDVSPTPTEFARVGIVLTEFETKQKTK